MEETAVTETHYQPRPRPLTGADLVEEILAARVRLRRVADGEWITQAYRAFTHPYTQHRIDAALVASRETPHAQRQRDYRQKDHGIPGRHRTEAAAEIPDAE